MPGCLLDRRHRAGRRPRQGRSAPVHGLRRLRDRLPLGRDELRLSSRAGLGRAAEAGAFRLRPGGRQGRLPAPAQCGREPHADREARAARERFARARDSARSPSSRLHRDGCAARGTRLWRGPGRGARDAERSRRIRRRVEKADEFCRDHRERARLRRDAFPVSRDRRARRAGKRHLGARSRGIGSQARDLQPFSRKAHHTGFRHRPPREAGAEAAGGDKARRRCPLRAGPRQQRDLHAVHGLRRRLPGIGARRWARPADAEIHRAQLRAVRAVREDLSRERDHARSAPAAYAAGETGSPAQRGGALQLRALRQALRHAQDGGQHARQAYRALDVRGWRGAEAAPDVRRLPRGGHDGKQGRDFDPGCKAVSATATPLKFQPPEDPEDQARAGHYALLARLFYSGPDAALLATIGGADEIASGAQQAAPADPGDNTPAAARVMEAEAARLEYDEILVGTGKAEVTPYASYYLAETGREKILARLRGELAGWGLARSGGAHEPEDRMAGLFDVMRHLISLGSEGAAFQMQRGFFDPYIARCYRGFCGAISKSEKANFYKHVAHFAGSFLAVETEALKVF